MTNKLSDLIVAQGSPQLLEWTRRGWLFDAVSTTMAGKAIPISTTATNSPTLWNPASSKKVLVPIRIALGLSGSMGATPNNSFGLATITRTGDNVATGLPFATFTDIVIRGNRLGMADGSSARFAFDTVTFTTQPTVTKWLGLGTFLYGTAAAGGVDTLIYDFNGSYIMYPGTAFSIVGAAASVSLYEVDITFAELDEDLFDLTN